MPARAETFGERAVALVAKEAVRHRCVDDGVAVVAGGSGGEAAALHVDAEVHVGGHEQIEPPVAVVVEERRARAPGGNVGPLAAVTSVNVPSPRLRNMRLAAEEGHVEIDPAVVVDVAGGGAHAVADDGETAALGHVGEPQSPIAVQPEIVAIQPASRRTTSRACAGRQRRSLNREHIEIAVVVVVEDCAAAADDLRQEQLTGGAVDVGEVEARVPRLVHEDAAWLLRGSEGRHRQQRQRQASRESHPRGRRCRALHARILSRALIQESARFSVRGGVARTTRRLKPPLYEEG